MVDVSSKPVSRRKAVAEASLRMREETFRLIARRKRRQRGRSRRRPAGGYPGGEKDA